MSARKPVIAMDISTTGKGGGPYTSTMNIIHSSLSEKYEYRLFEYKTGMGRFISLKRIRDIVRQLKEINPDIVHFSGLQLSGFHVALACQLAGINKSIVVIHGSSTEAMDINRIKRWMIYILEFFTLALTTTFYGVSKYSSRLSAAKFFKWKSSGYVYNLPIKSMEKCKPFCKSDFGFSDTDIVIVSVARITRDKGYAILKEAIMKLESYPQIKFLIVGDGDYLPVMRVELSKAERLGQVKFLGYRNDIEKILPGCDIFVLPTLHETLSIALLEASYNKLALIASYVGGVPEIISHGENGLLVPPSDIIALTKAIKTLAENPLLRKKMGTKAKCMLDNKFSEDLIIRKIDEIYKRLLA